MNTKKIIGIVLWLVAFAIPARCGLLETEEVSNITGLIGFVAFIFLLFVGYYLVDSSSSSTSADGHGH
jgi:uncharacterized membrane protein